MTTAELLTLPKHHFCPVCQIHNRSKGYVDGALCLLPVCPVCADKRRRGEPIVDPPAWDAGRAAWSTWVTEALPEILRPLAEKVGLR